MTKVARVVTVVAFAAVASASPAWANLITNGGFETGDFTGWTQGGALDHTFVGTDNPHSGRFAADLGPVFSDGTLSQTIATTPGSSYTISYWLFSDGKLPNDFAVSFAGTSSFSVVNLPSLPYTHFFAEIVAPTSSTTLTFKFRNGPGYLNLDDVEVNPTVPEPATLLLLGSGITGLALRRRRARG